MAVEATAQIVIKGSSEALKTLQGIRREVSQTVQDAKKAAKEEERAAKAAQKAQQEAARAAQKDAQQTAKVREKAAQDALKAEQKAASQLERLQERETKRWQDMARKAADARIRESERVAKKSEEHAKRSRAAWGGAIGAVTGGAIAGATTAMNTGRSVAGVKDLQSRIASGNEYKERMAILGSQAGMSTDERAAMEKRLGEVSVKSGKDFGELLAVLETGQAEFNNLRGALGNLEEIATISKASGADTADFAKAMMTLQQVFSLTEKEALEAAYVMKAASDSGSIEVKDFASNFASKAGTFQQSTKLSGMEGMRQFLGAAQSVGTGKFGAAESSTRMEQAVGALSKTDVLKELGKIGIKGVADANGRIDVAAVLDKLAGNAKFMGSATVRQEVFSDAQARQGIEAMLAARAAVQRGDTGAIDMRSIMGSDAAAGRETVAKTFAEISQSSGFKLQQEAARAQLQAIENLDSFNSSALKAAQAADLLEQKLGGLALWTDSFLATGAGSIAGGMAGNAAGNVLSRGASAAGGGIKAAAAGAGGSLLGGAGALLAAGGTAVGAASAGMIAGAVGLGAAGGAAGGWLVNQIVGGVSSFFGGSGRDLSTMIGDGLFNAIHGERDGINSAKQSTDPAAQSTRQLQLEEQKKQRVALEQIARNTSVGAPSTAAPRGPQ